MINYIKWYILVWQVILSNIAEKYTKHFLISGIMLGVLAIIKA